MGLGLTFRDSTVRGLRALHGGLRDLRMADYGTDWDDFECKADAGFTVRVQGLVCFRDGLGLIEV